MAVNQSKAPAPIIPHELLLYARAHSSPASAEFAGLAAATEERFPESAIMRMDAGAGSLLSLITRWIQPKLAVEIGTYTGYSALCIATELPEGGHLLTCDVNEQWAESAQSHWRSAGVSERITFQPGPALEALRSMPRTPSIDLALIDADKPSYIAYWEELVPRMQPKGVIIVDNTLFFGLVTDAEHPHENVQAVRSFNRHARDDRRMDVCLLPLDDGLTVAVKVAE